MSSPTPPLPGQKQGQDLRAGGGALPRQLWACSLGLAQQQGPRQLLRFRFCQTLIRHLISTFIKFVIFLRKPNRNGEYLRTR